MRRLTAIATSVMMTLTLISSVSAASTLAPPSKVTSTAGPGYYLVTWSKVPGIGVTYTVTGGARAATCVVVDATTCHLPAISTAPVRFRVTASRGSVVSQPSAPSSTLTTRLVLLVAGQSNAMGAESYAIDPTTKNNYFKAPYVNGADRLSTITWNISLVLDTPNGTFAPLTTPQRLVSVSGLRQIFGPEISLARRLYESGVESVGVMKVAFAGTSLANDWSPTSGKLYGAMIRFVHDQMRRDAASGVVDVLGAAYWFQGESDSVDAAMAHEYQKNLFAFIPALRLDLPFTPRAPVVLVKESMASHITYRFKSGTCGEIGGCSVASARDALIRSADDIAATMLPNVLTVDSQGLSRMTVGIHLSNSAELAIGSLMARVTEDYLHRLR